MKKKKKLLALIMSLVLLLTIVPLYQDSLSANAEDTSTEETSEEQEVYSLESEEVTENIPVLLSVGDNYYVEPLDGFENLNFAGADATLFNVNGGTYLGFCVDRDRGHYSTETIYTETQEVITDPNSKVYQTLYYGYGGPEEGGVYTFSSTTEAIVATSQVLSHYYSGTSTGLNYKNAIENLSSDKIPPAHTMSLSDTSVEAYISGGRQVTDWITLNLDSRLTANATIPSGVSLYIEGDSTAYTGTATIQGGKKFFLSAPTNVAGIKSVSLSYTGNKMLKINILEPPSATYQPVAFYSYINPYVSLSAEFEGSGNLTLSKSSSNPAVTNGNDCYDLAGAEYSVTNSGGTVVATFKTNSNGQGLVTSNTYNAGDVGTTTVTNLPSGTYTIKETQAPTNGSYEINTASQSVTITGGATTNATTTDKPANDPLVIRITKTDSEGNIKVGPSLAGAEFTIKYFDGFYNENTLPATATRTWVIGTKYNDTLGQYQAEFKASHKISGDAFYTDADGNPVIPLGTITIEETNPPFGYSEEYKLVDEQANVVDSGVYLRQITTADTTTPSINTFHDFSVEEVPIRTKLMFMKTDWETRQTMAGVPFRLSLLDADENKVESHIIVTDEDGLFDSSAIPTTTDTNGNDNATPSSTGLYDGLTPTGIWFSGSATAVAPDNTVSSFPCGTYMLEELPCTANLGRQLITPITFDITSESTVNLGNITNVPSLSFTTVERDEDNGGHLSIADDDVTIIDEVSYNFLTAGKTYTLLGLLVDKETGEVLKDNNGDFITNSTVFTTSANYVSSNQEICGTVESEFNFDARNLEGKTFVIYQYLYAGDKSSFELVSADGTINVDTDCLYVHDDIDNTYQTGYFPAVGTKAWVTETETNVSPAKKDLIIKDEVTYTGLNAGSEYKLEATLVDYETGEALTDEDGNVIKAVHRFTPTSGSGTEVVTFPAIDGSQFEDKKIVVFEGLYWDNKLYASHMDIDDEDQTIYFPKISTTAIAEDGTKFSPRNDNVTITDIVEYSNLKTDVEYELRGVLMSAETKEAVLDKDGNEVVATKKFTPDETEGTVELKFTFDATLLEGDRVVVFESVYYKDIEVCTHADITDEDQSVDFPSLETELTNKVTDSHNAYLDEEVVLIDTCEYKNLVVGEEYTITGVLMNKDTGNAIMNDNQVITSTVTFVPEKTSGVVEVEFKFNGLKTDLIKEDGTYSDIVCFETIYYDDIEFCVHADLEDEDQTVFVAELDTVAVNAKDGSKYLTPYAEVTLTDTLSFKSLDTTKTYVAEGILMTKDSEGNVIVAVDKDGNPVKSSIEFTPATADGTVYMNFTFDTTDFMNMKLTVFQRVYEKETKEVIAVHEDITDEDQTVTVSDQPKTGDNTPLFLLLGLALISIAGMTFILRRKNS